MGALVDGTIIDDSIPITIGTANDWHQIATGEFHSIAIKNDNTLWSWGSNNFGQLGNASNLQKNAPEQVSCDVIISSYELSHNNAPFKVFPNPVHDALYIESDAEAITKIQLFNVLGNLLSQTIIDHQTNYIFNFDKIKSGIYFMTIQSEKNLETIKLIRN